MKTFIFTADDFGWTSGQNLAVERAHTHGVLDRASMMASGGAFDQAVAIAKRLPSLGVGVHLQLVEGRPVSPPESVPRLVDRRGHFPSRLAPVITRWQFDRETLSQVRSEWDAQIRKVLSTGITLTHLDSHKHLHVLPPLCEIAIELAQAHAVPYLRLPLPPLATLRRRLVAVGLLWPLALRARPKLRAAGLQFADHFIGLAQSGGMTPAELRRQLAAAPDGTTEIMMHPAVPTGDILSLVKRYPGARGYRFADELAALCDPEVRALARR
jgi:hopanoid biosynthesis associated protein HpnK